MSAEEKELMAAKLWTDVYMSSFHAEHNPGRAGFCADEALEAFKKKFSEE